MVGLASRSLPTTVVRLDWWWNEVRDLEYRTCRKKYRRGQGSDWLGQSGKGAAARLGIGTAGSTLGGESILVGQHDGDGGLGIVDVEGAAGGDQLDELGSGVVVADVKGEGKPAAG